jgi:hypothetical protein
MRELHPINPYFITCIAAPHRLHFAYTKPLQCLGPAHVGHHLLPRAKEDENVTL